MEIIRIISFPKPTETLLLLLILKLQYALTFMVLDLEIVLW